MLSRHAWFCSAVVLLIFRSLAGAAPFEFPVKITQFPEGRIFFPIEDKKPSGDGGVAWEYKPTRWGMYELLLLTTTKGAKLGDVQVQVGPQKFAVPDATPDMGELWGSVFVSRVYLPTADRFELRVTSSTPAALAHLKGALLRPAIEGKPIVQDSDTMTLHARDAATLSVMMRYEPATNKNCLGYWTNPADQALWPFQVTRPGVYQIELWQGCGKGQGGSTVSISVSEPTNSTRLGLIAETRFVVEDTGHFQNFIPRELGQVTFKTPGQYTFFVRPVNKKAAAVMDIRQIVLKPVPAGAPARNPGLESLLLNERVVFLGDSITYGGEYIEYLETYLRLRYPTNQIDFINLGLPSETVSGLSEPGHAGGQFPRPDLHERLERVLEKAKPEVIFACYGMNDGIYHPFSRARFEAFERGLQRLRASANKMGAMLIHVTPPTFDPVPIKDRTLPAGRDEYRSPFENYNETLDRYSKWLVDQRAAGWEVIDSHFPMNQFLARQRTADPAFVLAGDGVHANAQGHWIIAREILRYLGAPEELTETPTAEALFDSSPRGREVHKLVQQRQRLLKDAWLSEVGHKRPGMSKGKPLEEAQREAAELDRKLRSL
jgi:lysophospholipase L1-like esterase